MSRCRPWPLDDDFRPWPKPMPRQDRQAGQMVDRELSLFLSSCILVLAGSLTSWLVSHSLQEDSKAEGANGTSPVREAPSWCYSTTPKNKAGRFLSPQKRKRKRNHRGEEATKRKTEDLGTQSGRYFQSIAPDVQLSLGLYGRIYV